MDRLGRQAALLQGSYYVVGGLWRLLHAPSFDAVAGPKPDRFQTDVTAALFAAAGTALLAGALPVDRPQWRGPGGNAVLAAACGLAVAAVDLRHRRAVRNLFRVEALLELGFAVAALAGPATRAIRRGGARPAQRGGARPAQRGGARPAR